MYLFFFNDTATTEIYTLSLHDALPILKKAYPGHAKRVMLGVWSYLRQFMYTKWVIVVDRKSTRLNSSHANISYAVFCLKKKNINYRPLLFHCGTFLDNQIHHLTGQSHS